MSDATSTTPAETTRTARFAQFLRAAVAMKTKVVTEVNKYPTVIWFSNLQVQEAMKEHVEEFGLEPRPITR